MLKTEKNYDFRKRMLEIHKMDIRDFSFKPDENMYELSDDLTVYIPDKSPFILLGWFIQAMAWMNIRMNTLHP